MPKRKTNGSKEASKRTKTTLELDPIQQQAIDSAIQGKNIFLTGVAGTGKSFIIQQIVRLKKESKKQIAVVAPTGVAAVNLNDAQTVHSLAGIKVPSRARDFGTMLSRVPAKRWKNLDVLVIDEIGMLQADFLDWLDVHVRRIRKNFLEAFGGIQLIFVGDFCQLGPIPGAISMKTSRAYKPNDPGADCFLNIKECSAYAFQSVLWREAGFTSVHLRTVYRQQNDQAFIKALQDLRQSNSRSPRVLDLIEQCRTPLAKRIEIPEGIRPTVLYCTNAKVDLENYNNLQLLDSGPSKTFEAVDSVEVDSDVPPAARDFVLSNLRLNKFFEQCQAAKRLELRIGAQVMLLQNDSKNSNLVNGSRGVVVRWQLCPVVRDFKRQEERLIGPDENEKFPGRRFDELKFGMTMLFESKQWTIFKFVKFPVVKFMHETKIILPTTFRRTLYRQGSCFRNQIPLRLAWAMTVHKSQGSTLDLVLCDLQGCFTSGQSYVALSRAKEMKGLEIRNFDHKQVRTDPLVSAFYDAMDTGTVDEFLENQAGLWWFPILEEPEWLNMFENASHSFARSNAAIFRQWVQDYRPPVDYRGWKGR